MAWKITCSLFHAMTLEITGSYVDPLGIITHSWDFSVRDCLDTTKYWKGPGSSPVVSTQDQRSDAPAEHDMVETGVLPAPSTSFHTSQHALLT